MINPAYLVLGLFCFNAAIAATPTNNVTPGTPPVKAESEDDDEIHVDTEVDVDVHVDTETEATMQERLKDAVDLFLEMKNSRAHGIPDWVLQKAKGVAIFEVTKAGVIVSGSSGEGVLVARTAQGWSPPLAISTGSAGLGLQLGAKVTKNVMIFNTAESLDQFCRDSRLTATSSAGVVAGPDTTETGLTSLPMSQMYVYQKTKGAYAGASVEGGILSVDEDTNRAFYKRKHSANEILFGTLPRPPEAQALYTALDSRYSPIR